jgi:hypothetical protein
MTMMLLMLDCDDDRRPHDEADGTVRNKRARGSRIQNKRRRRRCLVVSHGRTCCFTGRNARCVDVVTASIVLCPLVSCVCCDSFIKSFHLALYISIPVPDLHGISVLLKYR